MSIVENRSSCCRGAGWSLLLAGAIAGLGLLVAAFGDEALGPSARRWIPVVILTLGGMLVVTRGCAGRRSGGAVEPVSAGDDPNDVSNWPAA